MTEGYKAADILPQKNGAKTVLITGEMYEILSFD